jgi:hypothetical protein
LRAFLLSSPKISKEDNRSMMPAVFAMCLAGTLASTIAAGIWGGPHVSLRAEGAGATLRFDCAHGTIRAPLAVSADGKFRLSGVFVHEHGGPIRVGETENSQEASYSGQIEGKRMTLSIELTRDKTTLGPYTLELGDPGRVVKCL